MIFLLLLMLFVPSVYLDRLKKEAERNRAGLSDADARACICASFRYVLRWLRLAGLEPEKCAVRKLFGENRNDFGT